MTVESCLWSLKAWCLALAVLWPVYAFLAALYLHFGPFVGNQNLVLNFALALFYISISFVVSILPTFLFLTVALSLTRIRTMLGRMAVSAIMLVFAAAVSTYLFEYILPSATYISNRGLYALPNYRVIGIRFAIALFVQGTVFLTAWLFLHRWDRAYG